MTLNVTLWQCPGAQLFIVNGEINVAAENNENASQLDVCHFVKNNLSCVTEIEFTEVLTCTIFFI